MSLLFISLLGTVLVACAPKEYDMDVVELDYFTAGQVQVVPDTVIDAENVTFYKHGTDQEVQLDELAVGEVYDFVKKPDARYSAVVVNTHRSAVVPTILKVAKSSDTFRCPEWAVGLFGKKCEAKTYEIVYR